ncbi:MAG: DUF5715 family protein [Bacteroidales bacterium]
MRLPRFLRMKFFRYLFYLVLIIIVSTYLFSSSARHRFVNFFSNKCVQYKQVAYSRKLTDKIPDYSAYARRNGIVPCKNEEEINSRLRDGALVRVNDGKGYSIEKLSHSYPCLTRDSRELLELIARRFRDKTEKAGLSGAEMIITSMTRTTDKVKSLRRNNSNASANSPHLTGNAFDISYLRFRCRKMNVTTCDKQYMKEALAQVIWELRKEKKCWATYERAQSCYHVVAR